MEKIDKRIYLIFVVLIFICAFFQPVLAGINIKNEHQQLYFIDNTSAFVVACAKLKDLKQTSYTIISSDQVLDDNGRILCYIFNLNPVGYIVVCAYKVLPPVLAYSFTSSFSNKENCFYDLIKTDVMFRLTYLSVIPENTIKENKNLWDFYLSYDSFSFEDETICQWPMDGSSVSGGWLETKWSQYSPYNDFCPMDLTSGVRSVAGCPAIAMAQILNYHQTTNNIVFNDSDDYHHSYGGNNFWIDDDFETYDFPSFPQLNSYLDALVLNYQNHQAINDEGKAALVFACGVAAYQVYNSNGSGTFGINQAYNAYQRFCFYDCQLLVDEPDLYEQVQDNIINGLPVHLAVVDDAWETGHNLVIDGYRTDGFYHLNFGLGGYYDGWYRFPEDLPQGLTVLEGVIVDIKNNNNDSNLHSQGVLYWPNVKAGANVKGSFTIENVGESYSEIDWEVIVWPEWGDWSFDPSSGENLTPDSGFLTINVSVDVPFRLHKHFNGYVKVVDVNNSINSCLVHVSLTTKLTRSTNLNFIFQRNPFALQILRYLLNL